MNQTLLFTVIPRGISLNGETLPVSVFVTPRLYDGDRLGVFPDWLNWTSLLQEAGLQLTVQSAGTSYTASIDTDVLRPDLWGQLFNEETLVRSHQYDDYTQRGIISYSMRQSLSALKTIYQQAGVHLALPGGSAGSQDDGGHRSRLAALLEGLDVHWNADRAASWRDAVRKHNRSPRGAYAQLALRGALDAEGLIVSPPNPAALKQVAVPFAVFHHMPTPDREAHPLDLDPENLLDFHQALSALNAYPHLQRALGLVFDLDLPIDAVPETAGGQFGTLSIADTNVAWSLPTTVPGLKTAYVHFAVGGQRLFLTAPAALNNPTTPATAIGLLALDPVWFGLAQVDVDGGMHKAIILAESLNNPDPGRNLDPNATPEAAPHPEVFDPDATLPSLRSGGFSLFTDLRGLQLLGTMEQSRAFNDAVEQGGAQPRPFFAEDLVRGYRLDVWDSQTDQWHSLHERSGAYRIGDLTFETDAEEGFVQLAVTQPAEGAPSDPDDLYVHEAIARWAGWSLSAPRPGKHLSRYADPDRALPPDDNDPDYLEDQPVTPFDMAVDYRVVPGSLPRLRFGTRYRMRARIVDLAGNSLPLDSPVTHTLATVFGLPRDPEGFAYLRYEPVGAPLIVLRDPQAVILPGSAVDRIVIRTFNASPTQDTDAADRTAADRHLVPPRTSVEMCERHGVLDDASGKLNGDPQTWKWLAERDAGEFQQVEVEIAGQTKHHPIAPEAHLDTLPYLADPYSRGAALRDLPGAPDGAIGRAAPGTGTAGAVPFDTLSDPNPRAGSATMIGFGANQRGLPDQGFRFSLAEPPPGQTAPGPHWDPDERVLTVYVPKGKTAVVPVSSYLTTDDLKQMGLWQWLREYIERLTVTEPRPQYLQPGAAVDEIAHVLQRAVEGGHWMLTPPKLITLVHAVQQPIGRPAFAALNVDHEDVSWDQDPLRTASFSGRTDPAELAPITAWRRPGATDAYLMGALKVHGASTAKVDLLATWSDPVDDPTEDTWSTLHLSAHVDELPLPKPDEGYLTARGEAFRRVGYYDPEHDQIGFVRTGDWSTSEGENRVLFLEAAPRHTFTDPRHHRVTYTAVAASRYREYFPQDQDLDFTRESDPIVVDVPASERPLAPDVAYVLPTFGWQRQAETNVKRSVRFGGGLRVYLHRPWFSSGEGELLGVALWSDQNGTLDAAHRDAFKPFITQWGMDPIWSTDTLVGIPRTYHFPDAVSSASRVSLEERTVTDKDGGPGRIDVVGFPVAFDPDRKLWYADLTLNLPAETYAPFVRLALVRYQPHALDDARVSRVVVADFAQLTPDRSALVTADPHHPRTLRVVVSGVAPRGPKPVTDTPPGPTAGGDRPTQIYVRVQQRHPDIRTDLGWQDVAPGTATVQTVHDGPASGQPDLGLWTGTVTFEEAPQAGRYRLVIEEYEFVSADYTVPAGGNARRPAGRLIYAETFDLDDLLV